MHVTWKRALAVCALGLSLAACESRSNRTPAQRAGDQADRAADKTSDAARDTGDAAKDAGRDVKDEAKDATK